MPSAPPNSVVHSSSAETAPARFGGATLITISLLCVVTTTRPIAYPPTRSRKPHSGESGVPRHPREARRGDEEPAPDDVGAVEAPRERHARRCGAATATEGSTLHSAASSGLMPSTDCRN